MSETKTTLINPFKPHETIVIPQGTKLLSLNQITGRSINAEKNTEVNIMLAHQGRTVEISSGTSIEAPSVVFNYGHLLRAIFLDEEILKANNKPIAYATV